MRIIVFQTLHLFREVADTFLNKFKVIKEADSY